MTAVVSPKIAMIAAMAANRVIGANGDMPWHLPADLKHFKAVTLGKPVIMGRKTYESIGKALPGRHNIVVSRQHGYKLADADVVTTIEDALDLAKARNQYTDEIMIIGGGTLYEAMLPCADRLYLTFIDLTVTGDTHFPNYLSDYNWQKVSEETHSPDEKNAYGYTFFCLDKAKK